MDGEAEVSTIPPLNEPSFRLTMETQIAKLPPEHQTVIRSQMDALTDIYQAFTALNTKVNTIKPSVSSATSTSSSSSSKAIGVTSSQAASIATSTIQSTLAKVNPQVGTSYTVLNSDYQAIITLNNAAPVAVTLGGGGTGVGAQFGTYIENLGAGTVTLTPASGTINGAASIPLVTNQGAIAFFDGTNWSAVTSPPGSGGTITSVIAGTGLTGGGSSGAVTLAIAATGVTPGSYTNTNLTVNAEGQITGASNGSSGGSYSLGGVLSSANVLLDVGAGTGATFSIAGLDGSHNLVVNTGTTPSAVSVIATVTFTATRGHTVYPVVQANLSNYSSLGQIVYGASVSGTQYQLISGTAALNGPATYSWNISCP